MSEMTERELFRVRLRFLDLLKSFFVREPDAEKLGRWRGTFAALAGAQIHPDIDLPARECSRLLDSKGLQGLQEEYYRLFTDPFGEKKVDTTASYYLDGQNFGWTLASLRSFLDEARLAKGAEVRESEDSLVVMLDILMSLVEEEKQTGSTPARALQTRLLEEYLIPFALGFDSAMEANDDAEFYRACSRFLCGYLDLEKELSSEN